MEEAVRFPVLIREKGDASTLFRVDSLADARGELEWFDVRNNEYEGWDQYGEPVCIEVNGGPAAKDWLRMAPQSTPGSTTNLFDLIDEFGSAHGISAARLVDESPFDYFARINAAAEEVLWGNRSWWRRILGIPNPIQRAG